MSHLLLLKKMAIFMYKIGDMGCIIIMLAIFLILYVLIAKMLKLKWQKFCENKGFVNLVHIDNVTKNIVKFAINRWNASIGW